MRKASLFENAFIVGLLFANSLTLSRAGGQQLDECPLGCSSHGACKDGLCQCLGGWTGKDCRYFLAGSGGEDERLEEDENACLDGCSAHGSCNGGMCHCNTGWSGVSCNIAVKCESSCKAPNGKCVSGSCMCASGFFGPRCSDELCPQNCFGHGTCKQGACACAQGWFGRLCDSKLDQSLIQADDQTTPLPPTAQAIAQLPVSDDLSIVRRAVEAAGSAAEKLRHTAQHEFAEAAQHRVHAAMKQAHEHEKDIPGYEVPVANPPDLVANATDKSSQLVKSWQQLLSQQSGSKLSLGADKRMLPDKDHEDSTVLDSSLTFWAQGQKPQCEADCSGHGDCIVQGKDRACRCRKGWAGMLCDVPRCAQDCNGHGICLMSACVCNAGYLGDACGTKRCPDDCSGVGSCFEGKCSCKTGFAGPNCGRVEPAGLTITVKMKSSPFFKVPAAIDSRREVTTLRALPLKSCPSDCNQHGECQEDGKCACYTGYNGAACEMYCPNECSAQGNCIEGACLCYSGFLGVDCSVRGCCSGHGTCEDPEVCVCNAGWSGADCSVQLQCADPTCSGHGKCEDGTCKCSPGFSGPACAAASGGCMPACGPNGMCNPVSKKCECQAGYIGLSCMTKMESCPKDCSNKGLCMNGKCMCGAGWQGDDCSKPFFEPGQRPPIKNMKGSGSREDASDLQTGVGAAGFGGGDQGEGAAGGKEGAKSVKSKKQIIKQRMNQLMGDQSNGMVCGDGGGCSGHGTCNTGAAKCECDAAYHGPVCEFQHCAGFAEVGEECSGHGLCRVGECQCAPGWGKSPGRAGPNGCFDKICPAGCGDHGECIDGACVCQQGWTGTNCRDPQCPGGCAGHGQCSFSSPGSPGECACDYGWGGAGCQRVALDVQMKSCPNSCSGNGLCLDGICMCNVGFRGADCSASVCSGSFVGQHCDTEACPNDCSGQGLCMGGACICWANFVGEDCRIPLKCQGPCQKVCGVSGVPQNRCDHCVGECLTAQEESYDAFSDLKQTLFLEQNKTSKSAEETTKKLLSNTVSDQFNHSRRHREVKASTVLSRLGRRANSLHHLEVHMQSLPNSRTSFF